MKRSLILFVAVAAALTLTTCKRSTPAGVAATVNGYTITYAESRRSTRPNTPRPCEGSNEDLVNTQKMDLLTSLITNEIMLQKRGEAGLAAVDADVEAEFNKMKAPYTEEEFQKQLAERQ